MNPYPCSSFHWVSLPTCRIGSISAELSKTFTKSIQAGVLPEV
jgi:hypothetical protein